MKKIFCNVVLALSVTLSVCCGQAWEDILVNNVGTAAVPPAAQWPGGVCLVSMTIGGQLLAVGVQGLAPGAQVGNYADFGSKKGGAATVTTSSTNIYIVDYHQGADANGNMAIIVDIQYYATPCTAYQTPEAVNPLTCTAYGSVNWSDGTVYHGSEDSAVGPGQTWVGNTILVACYATYSVTFTCVSSGVNVGTNGGPSLPQVATNAVTPPPTTPQTNATVIPPVPPVTGSNILWNPGGGGFTENSGETLGNNLNNTLWTINQQNTFDAAGIISAVKNAEQQNHSDVTAIDTDIKNEFAQAHSDASGINNSINGLTNFMGSGAALTNYALNSSMLTVASNTAAMIAAMGSNTAAVFALLTNNQNSFLLAGMTNLSGSLSNLGVTMTTNNGAMVAFLATNNFMGGIAGAMTNLSGTMTNLAWAMTTNNGAMLAFLVTNQFGAGLAGALTNAAGAVGQLYSAMTNISDWTNLDIMSQTTGLSISNLLAGMSNLLSGLGTNLVGGITNGLSVTNYAKETTLDVITNQLAGIATNRPVWTNGLTDAQLTNQINAYQAGMSNNLAGAMASMTGLTNAAGVMGMGAVGQGLAGLPSDVDLSAAGAAPVSTVSLPSGINFQFGAVMPSYGPLRSLLAWATLVGLFVMNWRTTYTKIRDAFTSNQAVTAGTSMLGTNVNLSSALLVAVAIFAAATAIPALGVAVLTHEVSLFMNISSNPLSLLQGFGFGFTFLDQYIPLATVVSAVCTRVVFNVSIDAVAGVVMGIKLFLVGL